MDMGISLELCAILCLILPNIFSSYKFQAFSQSEPLLPFQQLMAVLPTASATLLPYAIGNIMNQDSEIGEFFPPEFKIDLSGKRREWEGIVCLPSVDILLFLAAYNKRHMSIPIKDAKRNITGKNFKYEHTYTNRFLRSYYGNIPFCKCQREFIDF